jgi:hypothetical protein
MYAKPDNLIQSGYRGFRERRITAVGQSSKSEGKRYSS